MLLSVSAWVDTYNRYKATTSVSGHVITDKGDLADLKLQARFPVDKQQKFYIQQSYSIVTKTNLFDLTFIMENAEVQ